MPLILSKVIENEQAILGVWEVEETIERLVLIANLSESERHPFTNIKNENRAKQWLVSRIVLNEISGESNLSIIYEDNGRPHIDDGIHHVSISHTNRFVSVILSRDYKVGIDIETIHPRILKVWPKFISKDENTFLENSTALTESLVLIWSAKEALFKMDGRGSMDFRRNISIKPFNIQKDGRIFGSISKSGISLDFPLNYQVIEDHVMVYVSAPI